MKAQFSDPKVIVELSRYEALELANYLDGSDMRLSVGDRLFYALRLRRAIKGE